MTSARPALSRSAARHRREWVRRVLWRTGVAAALVVGAGVAAPGLVAPGASSPTAQPSIEQVHRARPVSPATAPAARAWAAQTPRATAPATRPPRTTAPATPESVTSAAPRPTTTSPPAATGPTGSPSGAPGTAVIPAPSPTPVPPASADNPLAGTTFHGRNTGAAAAAAQPGRSAADAAALAELASVPTATWLGAWSGDVTAVVRQEVAAARAAGAVPVFVTYNVPGRDCGGYSAGSLGSSAAYLQWIQAVVAGIGTARAVVVVEPDALAQLCGDPAERTALLRSAVGLLEANPGTHTYVDAGHSDWIDAATMAERLRAAGGTAADGFALNVSNFETTASNVAYGQQISSLLGGLHFVIDTSRNGNGPGGDWCNPPGRALGERPTAQTGQALVDAYLWVKRVGESDGTCNGGPPAGTFWDTYALGLVRGR